MIEFTEDQERRAMRRDCRVWTQLMVRAWYTSDYPNATSYPAVALVADLQWIYFACYNENMQNLDDISLLGLIVLQAKTLNCSNEDVACIANFFLFHAQANNVNYAKNWIEIYLEEII
ncbi:hypothetical protein [Massilia rubra]|uniref:Uncharacterized protein n=1 Tax=Massilia rubra TaxID=2607910 RepID=A0ABX0LG45_9BURK|nr:hypothetical protein [Massilia rubra]NHZ33005.1 hypothetical protein [Massilia rubra]